MTDESAGFGDFEFERRFLVEDFPVSLRDNPCLIVQSYFLSDGGYALRIRCQMSNLEADVGPETSARELLDAYRDKISLAMVTVKGPTMGGTRYEAEREIDGPTAAEMIRRGGSPIVKTRYSAWIGADGWVIDVFGGDNSGLVIAECERDSPVRGLQIPDFCITELTDDYRFSNESLAISAYPTWAAEFARELQRFGPQFSDEFGTNTRITTG
jgi:CYTH domain-containing protein